MGPPLLNFSRLRSPAGTESQPGRRAQASRGGGSARSGERTRAPPPAGQGGTSSFSTATALGGGRVERRCRPGCRCRCRCRYHRRPAGSASQQNAVIRPDTAFLGAASRHQPSHPKARPSRSPASVSGAQPGVGEQRSRAFWGDCSPSVLRSELGLWALVGTPRREFPSCLSFVPSEREIGRAGGGGVFFGARGRCVCSGTKPSGDLGWGRGRLGGVPGPECVCPSRSLTGRRRGSPEAPRAGGENLALCRPGRLRQGLGFSCDSP